MPTRMPFVPITTPAAAQRSAGFGLLRLLLRWCDRHRQRRQLGELDDSLLGDVGLTRAMADAERRKPFWR